MSYRGMVERLKLALGQDGSIVTSGDAVDEHPGNTEAYLVSLGLTAADLRRLETAALAVRGYTREKTGMRCRWILLVPKELDGRTNEQAQGTPARVQGQGPAEGGGV